MYFSFFPYRKIRIRKVLLNVTILKCGWFHVKAYLLHKTCSIQTNSVSFHQPNIWKKIVYMFVSFLKHVSHYCYTRWDQKFGKFIAFSAETTIHNSHYSMCSIKLWAKDYPHTGHFGSVTYNRIQHCLANVLQLLWTNSVSFHINQIQKKIGCMSASFLKHVSHYC